MKLPMIYKIAYFGVAGIVVLGIAGIVHWQAYEPVGNSILDNLELKAPKEQILHNKIIKDEKGEDIVKYLYVSDIEVPQANYKGLDEDISKRTKNTQVFKNGIKDNREEFVARIYVGNPFYKDNDKWYQTKTATTTIEIFEEQTKVTFLDKIKHIFRQKVYAAGTEDPFYTVAGDGSIRHISGDEGTSQQNWDSAHEAAEGLGAGSVNYTLTTFAFSVNSDTSKGTVARGFFPINTSSLASTSTIESAMFYIYNANKTNNDNDGNDWINIVQTSQADVTELVDADFNECGATTTPSEGATRVDLGSVGAGYTSLTLNSTGLGWIKKSGETSNCGSTAGYTCLGIRHGHDAIDHLPVDLNYLQVGAFTGSNPPYLEVVFLGAHTLINTVITNADFVMCYSQGTALCYALEDGNIRMGYRDGVNYGDVYSAARFQNVKIPQGVTISSATWSYTAWDNDASTDNITLFAEDEDDSVAISTTFSNDESPYNKTPTTASTNWTLPNQVNGTVYTSEDISAVIQEVISREGWVHGNDLTILIRNNGATENHNAENWDSGVTTLTVEWDDTAEEAVEEAPQGIPYIIIVK